MDVAQLRWKGFDLFSRLFQITAKRFPQTGPGAFEGRANGADYGGAEQRLEFLIEGGGNFECLADARMLGLITVGGGRRQQPQRQIFSVLVDFAPNQKVGVIVLQQGAAFLSGEDQPITQVLNGIR